MESKTVIFILFSFVCVLKAEGPNFKQKDTFVQQEFDNVYQDLRGKAPGFKDYAYLSSTQTFSGLQTFLANGTTAWKMTSAGEITQPLQPSFLATNSVGANNVTGDGTVYTVLWGNEIFDQGSDFASNTFTAPVTGIYLLSASVTIGPILVTHQNRNIIIHTSNRNYYFNFSFLLAEDSQTLHVSTLADMDASDTADIQIQVTNGTKTVGVIADPTLNYFSGSLIN